VRLESFSLCKTENDQHNSILILVVSLFVKRVTDL
jgi:hypothetical protein